MIALVLTGCLLGLQGVGDAVELKLNPPACQVGGVTMVPVRQLAEWLEVETTYDAGDRRVTGRFIGRAGSFAVTAGSSSARVLGEWVPLPAKALLAWSDVYAPIRFLAELFEMEVDWNAADRRVTLRRGERDAAFDVPPPVYPLVSAKWSLLLGGLDGRDWVAPEPLAARLGGGERYRLYGLTEDLGWSAGAKPRIEEPGEYRHVDLEPRPEAAVVAVGAPWNAAARPVVATDLTQPTYVQAVRDILRGKGLATANPRLTQVLRVDLEGDGTEEVLFAATTGREHYPRPDIAIGDYSFVALRQVLGGRVKTTLLTGEFYDRQAEFAAPCRFEVAGALDLNGDDVLEILVAWEYYEGAGMIVFELRDGRPVEVLQAGAGA